MAWGYVIRPDEQTISFSAIAEIVATCAALVLFLAAYAHWFIPGSMLGSEHFYVQSAWSVILLVGAVALYFFANRGLCPEVQVDLQKRVVRTARRPRNGASTHLKVIPFGKIEDVIIKPTSVTGVSQIFLRLRQKGELVEVVKSPEAVLKPIQRRMIEDIRSMPAGKRVIPARPVRSGPAKRSRNGIAAS